MPGNISFKKGTDTGWVQEAGPLLFAKKLMYDVLSLLEQRCIGL